ncbi:TROVE domain-containing protein [Aquimarina litoralis]|uniref:TROVE domain-containing protein n=1 Tax=Aquimarina litoralis TaxID=584605 RepID=UPI001C57753F|nr:TROVE domain-containing protein [Aquimarina litoralis]MBW1297857.1 TROVE domain-containing protein [Aquimarina litoralis]
MKFNVFTKSKNEVRNYQGAKAFRLSPEMELYTAVVNSTLEKTNYEATNDRLKRIIELVQKNDPYFVAQLAVYARQKMYLRSIPIVLAVELSKIHSGDNLVRKTVNGVIQRADEITELLAYYQVSNQRAGTKKLNKLSKQIQKGIVMALNKFDAYQFAKYNRKTEVTFKDAIFLTHPKPKDDIQQSIFDKVISDSLEVPYTWEVELSTLGQQKFTNDIEKQKAFTAKWEELIDSNKLGYMALMRNLRNILEADVSHAHIAKIVTTLTNESNVKRSKQLPFRFMAAYQELSVVKSSYTSYILDALEKAIQISVINMKGFELDTKVVVACDVSGSMMQPISRKSKIQAYDIGLVLGMLLQNKCKNVITGLFGDRWKQYVLPKGNVLSNVMKLKRIEGEVGYSTNGYKVIQSLNNNRTKVDKVMIFTDCQLWNSGHYNSDTHIETEWKAYKILVPNAKLYIFDLMGYNSAPLQVEKNDVYLIGGWSDKVFEVLDALENGNSVIQYIKEQSL